MIEIEKNFKNKSEWYFVWHEFLLFGRVCLLREIFYESQTEP
jgi:hypothetical protein